MSSAAIGAAVKVFWEEEAEWRSGVVEDVGGQWCRIRYTTGELRWERETRMLDAWHCRGKSRIRFLPAHQGLSLIHI